MSSTKGHVEIAGGGISGLTAAAALARSGWTVRVHEANESVSSLGAGIYLWGNGLAVLRELGVEDMATTKADLVLAADGVGSQVRESLGLLRRRQGLGQRCARLLLPRVSGDVPKDIEDNYIEYMSGRRFLLYTPSSLNDLYLALVCPTSDTKAMGGHLPKKEWIESFPSLEPLIRRMGPIPRWDDFEWVELSRWSAGRVAILGDAAHAQPPYLGQGGGSAMMSAFSLAQAVSEPGRSLEHALDHWEATQRPVIEHTQRFSVRVGELNDVPDEARREILRVTSKIPRLGQSRARAATTLPSQSEAP